MKKDSCLKYFILCFPFIDFLTSVATWNGTLSVGLVIKGFFLLYALGYIVKNSKNKRKTYMLLSILTLYGLITLSYWYVTNPSAIFIEIQNLIKIFYLPVLIYFFDEYKGKNITRKTIAGLLLMFLILYLGPYPLGLGHNIRELYPNKDLYLSYFYVGNELANIFILLIPIAFTFLIEIKSKWFFVYLVLTLCMLVLLGTKAMYISILLILGFLGFYYKRAWIPIIKKHLKIFSISIIAVCMSLIFYIPNSNFYQNIKTSLEFYQVTSLTELLSWENVDNIVYSNRLDFLKNIHNEYKEKSWQTKLFGIGREKINQIKDIEIDIFDIFYSIGILGIVIYLIVFIWILKDIKLNTVCKFTFILLMIISLFTGHVLISPMTSTYLACLFGVNKEQNLEKRRQ